MGLFRRARDFPGRFRHMDSLMVLLIAILLLWFVGVFNPQRFIGPISSGPSCTSMASPDNDNSRSLLAYLDEEQTLELTLRVTQEVAPNGNLVVDIIFVNRDRGPITIYLPTPLPTLTLTSVAPGQSFARPPTVSLQIANVVSNQTWLASPNVAAPVEGVSFPEDDLILLLADEQCYVRYEFPYATLAQNGIGPGQYRIQGFYVNTVAGRFVNDTPVDPTTGLQPTAAFSTQGAWRSNNALQTADTFLFNVVQTASSTIAP